MSLSRRVVAGVVVAFAAVLAVAAPASAHDELLSSSPTADQRFAEAPAEVSLTFSDEVLDTGAAVIVADGDGRDWAAGDPIRTGASVIVPLEPEMPAGGYEMRWRVVSSDGHPISGIVAFTVGDGTPLERSAATAAPDAAPAAGSAQDQTAQENEGALRLVLVGGGGAIVAVVLFALITFLRRRRVTADGTEESER